MCVISVRLRVLPRPRFFYYDELPRRAGQLGDTHEYSLTTRREDSIVPTDSPDHSTLE